MKDNENYFVFRWMRTELKIKNLNELNIYAIIYSFYILGVSEVKKSLKYFTDTLDCSERTVSTALNNLIKRGLIYKTSTRGSDGGTRNTYNLNLQVLKDIGVDNITYDELPVLDSSSYD